ncbi:hypothetical protein BMS3Bbin05_00451 [bacterium BMS3Bbin05]|nr:hypothetical protein BMS3Bbin05_00451 [bacterium BMS3Bbin05]
MTENIHRTVVFIPCYLYACVKPEPCLAVLVYDSAPVVCIGDVALYPYVLYTEVCDLPTLYHRCIRYPRLLEKLRYLHGVFYTCEVLYLLYRCISACKKFDRSPYVPGGKSRCAEKRNKQRRLVTVISALLPKGLCCSLHTPPVPLCLYVVLYPLIYGYGIPVQCLGKCGYLVINRRKGCACCIFGTGCLAPAFVCGFYGESCVRLFRRIIRMFIRKASQYGPLLFVKDCFKEGLKYIKCCL